MTQQVVMMIQKINDSHFSTRRFFYYKLPKSEVIATTPNNQRTKRGNGKIEEVCAGKVQ